MSEIKQAGIKGYALLGAFIAILLFLFLVIYIYKANGNGVPESPDLYGYLAESARAVLRA
ncbi:hypothetical protein [Neolewinella antarctica]|uniref:Uncharacterized protein n=1 Tax=Neolewinella antarctica TaxID=442734 RepID=A0ABX0XA77_9BACT|nr:hypothetical protein [Neolewinella antarctica]NJC26169.1 hypothetical protein [Neolewinella antarctica]